MTARRFILWTAKGVICVGDMQDFLKKMIKSGTVNNEFPEFGGDLSGSMVHVANSPNDPEIIADLINLGWPIFRISVNNQDNYGIPKSIRDTIELPDEYKNLLLH